MFPIAIIKVTSKLFVSTFKTIFLLIMNGYKLSNKYVLKKATNNRNENFDIVKSLILLFKIHSRFVLQYGRILKLKKNYNTYEKNINYLKSIFLPLKRLMNNCL